MQVKNHRHLLVDGSNALHGWAELCALAKRDREAARGLLLRSVQSIHDAESHRVTVVFDGRGPELTTEFPTDQASFAQVFTPTGMTADDVIEQLVGKAADPGSYVVVTNDRAERQTVEALGATGMAVEDLVSWVGRVEARMRGQLIRRQKASDNEWRGKRP